MKRYPFVCKNCGARFRLQAWKAECPSCGAEFTLEPEAQEPLKKGNTPALLAATSAIGYVFYSLVGPSLFSAIPLIPSAFLQVLTVMVAFFSALGSFPALAVAAPLGAGVVVFHTFFDGLHGLVGLLLGTIMSVTSAIALYRMRRFLKQTLKDVDARSMPEYSGWGASKQHD
ncbi:MAG: hypothetical protein QXF45_03555 [Candidatus Caldarchaeum sp.]